MGQVAEETASEQNIDELAAAAAHAGGAGDWVGAEQLYRQIIARQPADGAAFHNLGVVLAARGEFLEAVQAHWNACVRGTARTEFWIAFGEKFRLLRFEEHQDEVAAMCVACLCHPGLNPDRYGNIALNLLTLDPVIGPLLDEAPAPSDAMPEWIATVAQHPLLLSALRNTVLPSLSFEDLVRSIRGVVLRIVSTGPAPVLNEDGENLLGLAVALACHADRSGFIVGEEAWETAALDLLVERVCGMSAYDFTRLDLGLSIAMLGAYRPLLDLPELAEPLGEEGAVKGTLLEPLVDRQVLRPQLQRTLAEAVPALSEPRPGVSEAVAAQYEAHPYPRWTRVDADQPQPAPLVLLRQIPELRPEDVAHLAAPSVLVAGCGTGKQCLDLAFHYENCHITGLDLSRASLGYAAAGALRYGLENVAFAQADILDLVDWDARFDLIEVGGVLHHMEDPIAGWSSLVGLLEPKGLMKVGLYSTKARGVIARARALLAPTIYAESGADPREARRWLVDQLSDEDRRTLTSWKDFYAVEDCRDLLFHVQEHTFDLAQIEEALEELDLEFLGFETLDAGVHNRFREEFGPSALRDLSKWDTFENRNPGAFSAMYQFWVRRRSA